MFRRERRERIVALLEERGSATVEELAELCHASVDSIRKDLQQLVREGRCERYYGGARRIGPPPDQGTPNQGGPLGQGAFGQGAGADDAHANENELIGGPSLVPTALPSGTRPWPWDNPAPSTEPVSASRGRPDVVSQEARLSVARRAYLEINDGDAVFLDVSRTNALLADLIAQGDKHVIVTTNMMEVIQRLSGKPHVTLVSTGGYLNVQLNGFLGSATISLLEPLLFSKAFIGADGVNLTNAAVTTDSIDAGEVKERVIHNASYPFLLAEEQKFRMSHRFRFATVTDFCAVITDTDDPEILAGIARQGVAALRAL
ncbi:DeoR/GlpR family DNA-binding transcription regulator [Olsenella sp. HMSC062G07]|uniref:DeoR/GlpR family DNA-binding transcription regulator n=1 Tax=Olsenella sp. HMSC062G07 TaxID=1739330 RepID=UPI0008A3B937|nr:DeoR/GlpR family DNA-binding transcription regulator [Olsenella sp. HMSC062G07]OFK22189.1 hypothetical protein HMPREF2826_02520 [Olsenella sp. HMSC062G07]